MKNKKLKKSGHAIQIHSIGKQRGEHHHKKNLLYFIYFIPQVVIPGEWQTAGRIRPLLPRADSTRGDGAR
jgi:hypothetical protein